MVNNFSLLSSLLLHNLLQRHRRLLLIGLQRLLGVQMATLKAHLCLSKPRHMERRPDAT